MPFSPVFSSKGTLTPSDYIKALVASVLSLAAYYLAVRFIPPLVCSKSAMNEGTGSGTCVFPVLALYMLLPVLFLVLAYSIGAASMRRARDAGLPAFVGVLIPLLILANQDIMFYEGYARQFRGIPGFLLFAIVCIGLLSLLPSRKKPIDLTNSILPTAILTIGVLIAVASILQAILAIPVLAMGTGLVGPGRHSWMLGQFIRSAPYLMPVFALLAGAFVFQHRRQTGGIEIESDRDVDLAPLQTEPNAGPQARNAAPSWPPFLLGAAITMIVLAVVADEGLFLSPIGIALGLFSCILPTFALYTFPIWAAWKYATARNPVYLAFLLVSLLPFAAWYHTRQTAIALQAEERKEVAAIQTVPLSGSPSTLLFESWRGTRYDCLLKATGTTAVITKVGFERDPALKSYKGGVRSGSYAFEDVSALPDEYLDLRIGKTSSFAKPRQSYLNDGGPLELRYIAPGHDDLLAVDYRSAILEPAIPPALTLGGWLPKQRMVTTADIDRMICDFARRGVTRN